MTCAAGTGRRQGRAVAHEAEKERAKAHEQAADLHVEYARKLIDLREAEVQAAERHVADERRAGAPVPVRRRRAPGQRGCGSSGEAEYGSGSRISMYVPGSFSGEKPAFR
jgi:hypothetical protein